eukprot:8786405-Ditylum_brightwellii.AAC.1
MAKQNWTTWMAVHMVSNKDFWHRVVKDQDSDMTWFYETYGGGLFKRTLDSAERLTTVGYAAYSSNFADSKAINTVIDQAFVKNGFEDEVRVKLKKIP